MKVVLADDDKVVVQMISAGLKKRGIEIIPAFDAMQVVMVTMKSAPDAVIPIVAITGSATEEARKNALELGAVECLEKPVDLDALAALLKQLTGAD